MGWSLLLSQKGKQGTQSGRSFSDVSPFRPLFGRPVLSYTAYPLVPAPLPLPSSHGRTPKNSQTSLAPFPAEILPAVP